ncbi:hypothetical protein F503_02471 [Ophiostoma piceae UAMH 11346]|uniref:Uncharacterized protein n=1 Tax=Ophiostoma piceae (strain UAMH 11346) TaxID=1262450 RepID=S3CIW2_OPHP1|nr:hypothetical protein F503_02471 [Ophiostoma piceae UAMH 11346]
MGADESDQIEAVKSIDDMLDRNSLDDERVDDERVDGDMLDDCNSRETEDARRPLAPDVTTRSQPPTSSPLSFFSPPPGRQHALHLLASELDTNSSTYKAETRRDTPSKAPKTQQALRQAQRQTRATAKTHALGGTETEAGTTQPKPRIRRARLSSNTAVIPRNRILSRSIPPDDGIDDIDASDTSDTSDTMSLPSRAPMTPLVHRPLPPAKAMLAVQLKVNLEIEVVIKARICGDVLLSVL